MPCQRTFSGVCSHESEAHVRLMCHGRLNVVVRVIEDGLDSLALALYGQAGLEALERLQRQRCPYTISLLHQI